MKQWRGWSVLLLGLLATAHAVDAQPRRVGREAEPAAAWADSVGAALEDLDIARRWLVEAMFTGNATGMDRAGTVRDGALETLARAADHPEVIGMLPWPVRTDWIAATLRERRHDETRALLTALGGELPATGSPSLGPAGLAVGVAARRLIAVDTAAPVLRLDNDVMLALDDLAADALDAARDIDFLLRDEALYQRWETAHAAGDSALALACADSLATRFPASPRTPRVRMDRARALLASGDAAGAVEEARRADPGHVTAELRWFLARANRELGLPRQAARELEHLIIDMGTDSLAIAAYETRVAMGEIDSDFHLTMEDRIGLARWLLPNPHSDAVDWMSAVAVDSAVTVDVRVEAGLHLVRYLYGARRYPEAEPALERLLTEADGEERDEAQLILARILRNTARLPEMTGHYRALIERGGTDGAQAAWELGREMESWGRWEEAEAAYTELLEDRPGKHHRDALFRRGFTRDRQGDSGNAAEDFRAALRASAEGPDREQAAFWLARTLSARGDQEGARTAAGAGATTPEPADYYGVRLRALYDLPSTPPTPPTQAFFLRGNPLEMIAEEALWPAALEERFYRGLALARLGLHHAARAEWVDAAERGRREPTYIQALAVVAAAYNIYPEGVFWANRSRKGLSGSDPLRAGFERLAIPAAYYHDVAVAAEVAGIPARPLWAVMRQESLYDPLAVSRAGALGLLQLMPATLVRMANEGTASATDPDVLFQPATNIALGTRFFADRLEEFGGRLLPTLAAYNAGEGKAWEWLELAGEDDQEVFIECVGYRETYGYVRRIPWLIWVYQAYYTETHSD